jgi:hypothetical protein
VGEAKNKNTADQSEGGTLISSGYIVTDYPYIVKFFGLVFG